MANLRAVSQDQEPWRLVDEDPDQHSHPLFQLSPGMKMQGARGREGIKRHRRRSERFPRNERQLSHERIETISKSGDRPKPTNRANPREGDGWKATDEEARTKDQAPRLKQGTVQACRTGQPRTSTATTEPVEGSEAPRNHSSEAGATQE